ncbi:hypothetical protein [Lentzea sp. NPDC060358]|uniref:hypothetical protein n=1 Tax=Lentzea sp. NPDC060358 TaxID=3347103 RepID=UPI00365ADD4E
MTLDEDLPAAARKAGTASAAAQVRAEARICRSCLDFSAAVMSGATALQQRRRRYRGNFTTVTKKSSICRTTSMNRSKSTGLVT